MADIPPVEDWEEWNPQRISFMHHMLAGSLAGLAEHIAMFPVDTVKTNLQCDRCGAIISPIQTWECAMRIIRNEGVFRLWRGVTATFAGCLPAHAAYFTVYETNKKLLGADREGHHPIKAALTGASAAVAHDVFMAPFDTIKQRMQLGYYKNILHCMKTVMRTEGFGAFYLAFPATLLMNIPYGGVMMSVNESCKTFLNPSGEYNFSSSMIAGSLAGSVAAAVTTPLDVIKTRLQTQHFEPCPSNIVGTSGVAVDAPVGTSTLSVRDMVSGKGISSGRGSSSGSGSNAANNPLRTYSGLVDVARRIYAEEGIASFARGMGPRMLSHAPAVAISWTTYECMKSLLSDSGTDYY
jgi:solute carrier family 25 (mitochondrial iron transporter), member 28/37